METFIIGSNCFIILNLFIIAIIFWAKKNNTLSNLILGAYILLHAVILIFNILTYTRSLDPYFYFLISFPACLIGPFAFLYYRLMLHGRQKVFVPGTLLHFIPALVLTLGIALAKYLLIIFPDHPLSILAEGPGQFPEFIRFAISFHIAGYYLYTWFSFRKFRKSHQPSELQEVLRLSWVRDFIYITVSLIACFLVSHFLSIVFIKPVLVGSSPVTPVILLVFYFLILKKSFSYSAVFAFTTVGSDTRFLVLPSPGLTEERKKTFNGEFTDELENRLNHILETDKPYIDQDLTLKKLSLMLDTPAKNLSRFINKRYQKNFRDFINHYRVEESKKMLLDPQNDNLKLEAIAEAAGFSSRASFFSVFRKFAGQTPASFRKTVPGLCESPEF